jgi:hypothetical protein
MTKMMAKIASIGLCLDDVEKVIQILNVCGLHFNGALDTNCKSLQTFTHPNL